MATAKKRNPPEDVNREGAEPSKDDRDEVEVDIDDAQIEEPKDDAFRKPPQTVSAPKRRRKKA